MTHFFRSLAHSIRNLVYWFPVIWRDWDWDDDFFMDILIHKLSSMERYFSTAQIVMDSEVYADEIRTVVQKLQAVRDQLNENAAFGLHEKKWGEAEWHYVPTEHPNYSELIITHPNAKTEQEQEQARQELSDAFCVSEMDDEVLLHEAFQLIAENMRKWWD